MKNILNRIKGSRFAQDSFWALLGNFVGKGLTMLGALFVARFLGKDVFGEFGTIKSTVVNIAMFSTFGLGYTANKYIAQFKHLDDIKVYPIYKRLIRLTLKFSLIIAAILFVTAQIVSERIFDANYLSNPLRLMAVWIVFSALSTTQIGVLSGLRAFKEMAKINAFVGAISLISSIALTYYAGLYGALFSLLIGQIFHWYLNQKTLNSLIAPIEYPLESSFKKEVLKFSFPIALHEGLYALSGWVVLLMLLKTGGYGEVGLYSASLQWSAIILFIPAILRNVILTHLSSFSQNVAEHSKMLRQTLLVNVIATCIPLILVWSFLPFILDFYGPSFNDLREVLLTLVLSTIFVSINNVYAQAFMSQGRNWLLLGLRLVMDISVVLTYLLVNKNYFPSALSLAFTLVAINALFVIINQLVYRYQRKK